MNTAERRSNLRETLVALAERFIDNSGLAGMKARELAAEAGCSVGAIYNVVADLDELVIAVNGRTLDMMETAFAAAAGTRDGLEPDGADEAIEQMVRLALAYLHFAAAHERRWRTLFDHRLPPGQELPEWYVGQQGQMFGVIEQALRILQPDLAADRFELLARSLFSAVHGIVALGLEEKLGAISVHDLEEQTTAIVTAIGRGLRSVAIGPSSK